MSRLFKKLCFPHFVIVWSKVWESFLFNRVGIDSLVTTELDFYVWNYAGTDLRCDETSSACSHLVYTVVNFDLVMWRQLNYDSASVKNDMSTILD